MRVDRVYAAGHLTDQPVDVVNIRGGERESGEITTELTRVDQAEEQHQDVLEAVQGSVRILRKKSYKR